MARKKHTQSPEYLWEEALLDFYYDHYWHTILDPLAEQFDRWKAGEVEHNQLSNAIHQTHKQIQQAYGVFTMKRALLVRAIHFHNEEWFQEWVKENPPPPGYNLYPPINQ